MSNASSTTSRLHTYCVLFYEQDGELPPIECPDQLFEVRAFDRDAAVALARREFDLQCPDHGSLWGWVCAKWALRQRGAVVT